MADKLKYALVKQDVYKDLYVCPPDEIDSYSILVSSLLRVGPIGLIAELDADFYIVQEEKDFECQAFRVVIPGKKYATYQTYKHIPSRNNLTNSVCAINCRTVDWGKYDIVVSINVSIPCDTVRKYPGTLFCFMIGEANMAQNKPHFGYDISFNQLARGIEHPVKGVIDMPYTFLGGNTLQNLLERHLQRESRRRGAFAEINSSEERPVTKVPIQYIPLQKDGCEIILHNSDIAVNLERIYDAKYFIKIGGRKIRGNSVAEAISLGTLVLMNRDEVIHKELIIDECNVKTIEELITKIHELDSNDDLYYRLLNKQKDVLNRLFYESPIKAMEKALEEKRNAASENEYTIFKRISDHLLIGKTAIHGYLYLIKKAVLKYCQKV